MAKAEKTFYPDPDANSFFAVGQEFFRDAQRQIRMANMVTNTAYILIGFALELVLKSYIVHNWIKTPGQVYGHDLGTLWEWAATGPESPCTLPIPDWLVQANAFHVNHLGGYRPPDVTAFAVPGTGHLIEMAKLVERVRELVAAA